MKVPLYTAQMNVVVAVPYPIATLLLCEGLLGYFIELSVSLESQGRASYCFAISIRVEHAVLMLNSFQQL